MRALHVVARSLVQDGREKVTLKLVGSLDMRTTPVLADAVDRLGGRDRPYVVIDVSRLVFCDSTGLSALLHAWRTVEETGGEVAFRGVHGTLRRMLTLTGLDTMIGVDA